MTLQDIKNEHPFPWQEHIFPKGRVAMIDANGREVALFAITAFCGIVTTAMALKQEAA